MSRGVNISSAHRQNRALVLRLILQNEGISRVKLAEMTHLTAASMSNIVAGLIHERWISETGEIDSTGMVGRKSIGLKIREDHYGVIAIHMHRKGVVVACCHLNGTVAAQMEHHWEAGLPRPEELGMSIKTMVGALTKKRGIPPVLLGISVATTGIVDAKRGIVYASVPYQWQNIDWGHRLQELIGFPVIIDNNARGMALAEILYGQHSNSSWLVFLYAGWGTGLGVIANGAVFRGGRGVAGEVGHVSINWQGETCWCGNVGCLEVYLNQGRVMSLLQITSADQIATALGQSSASVIREEVVEIVTTALVSLVNMYNPDTVIIGGWLDDAWPTIAPDVMERMSDRTRYWNDPPVRVERSSFGNQVGIRGASAIGLEEWVYGHGAYLHPRQRMLIDTALRPDEKDESYDYR